MLHIDGDIIAYRIACAIGEGEAASVPYTINSFISGHILVHFPELTPYSIYLSGSTNFRDSVGVTAPYKGNRWTAEQRAKQREQGKWLGWLADTDHLAPKVRPVLLATAREHLVDFWDAMICEGIEADDAIATAATAAWNKYINSEETPDPNSLPIICSVDKDFDQIAGVMRFDFVAGNTVMTQSPLVADRILYKQVLTGDSVDNIVGLEKCGPAMASELIDGCVSRKDMVAICVDQMGMERFVENYNLVYLLRSADEWDAKSLLTERGVKDYLGDLL